MEGRAMGGPRVGVVVGSRSDIELAERAERVLQEFAVQSETRVISAHRAPALLDRYLEDAPRRGVEVFIAIAGLAAHLPGVIASRTVRPVIGLPAPGGPLDGLDALLSVVQMPRGVPVATVGIGNAENAALLAVAVLAVAYPDLRDRLVAYREMQAATIADDPANVELAPVKISPSR
jgi:phosphoribosylaminoimidazole carboxylase PurE protein